jgi:formate dehydrogenase maturation protein FdhE
MVEEEKLDVEKWLQDLKEKAKGEEKVDIGKFLEDLKEKDTQKGKEVIENFIKKHGQKPKKDFNWEDFIKKYKK